MIRKSISLIMIILLFLPLAIAQEEEEVSAGVTPSDVGYGLDLFIEKIQSLLTPEASRNALLHLKFAQERLSEMQDMAARNIVQNKHYERAKNKYEENVNKAIEKANGLFLMSDRETFLKFIEEQTSKHLQVLEMVKLTAPQQALKGIENAIEKSQQMKEKVKKPEPVGVTQSGY